MTQAEDFAALCQADSPRNKESKTTTITNFGTANHLLLEALAALRAHFQANSEIKVGRDGRERYTINSMNADHQMKDVMRKIEEYFA